MDAENLAYFRTLLEKMLQDIYGNTDSTKENFMEANEVFSDPADRATAESDKTFVLRLRDRERKLVKNIEAALQRVEDGTYGICEECHEEISMPRLKARPMTRLCIECKMQEEQREIE